MEKGCVIEEIQDLLGSFTLIYKEKMTNIDFSIEKNHCSKACIHSLDGASGLD